MATVAVVAALIGGGLGATGAVVFTHQRDVKPLQRQVQRLDRAVYETSSWLDRSRNPSRIDDLDGRVSDLEGQASDLADFQAALCSSARSSSSLAIWDTIALGAC
jgi:hypothetical protein